MPVTVRVKQNTHKAVMRRLSRKGMQNKCIMSRFPREMDQWQRDASAPSLLWRSRSNKKKEANLKHHYSWKRAGKLNELNGRVCFEVKCSSAKIVNKPNDKRLSQDHILRDAVMLASFAQWGWSLIQNGEFVQELLELEKVKLFHRYDTACQAWLMVTLQENHLETTPDPRPARSAAVGEIANASRSLSMITTRQLFTSHGPRPMPTDWATAITIHWPWLHCSR